MNYSDYDSDGYSSNEDVDYVPSDDNLSEDDLNQCEKEDPLDENDDVPRPDIVSKQQQRKKKKENNLVRKRKKGGIILEGEEKDGGGVKEEEEPREELEVMRGSGKKKGDEETQKKKSDDLWASFLSDVGSRPTPSTRPGNTDKANSSGLETPLSSPEPKAPQASRVTITKVFDFAGEEVRVTKEVCADSKEAKGFLKNLGKQEEQEEDQGSDGGNPETPGPSVSLSAKRPAGMSSLLGRLAGKKPKMSTLEKSKMDWDAFKSEEGITEELAIHNRGKEGYVERKNFLERVDHRQFELEKAVRLTNMKQ